MLTQKVTLHDHVAGIGDNRPPGPIPSAKEAMREVSAFMADVPSIESHEQAKQGGAYVERTRIALAEMETERKVKVDPLNAQLGTINSSYRIVREPLEKILLELKRRLTNFASAEEAKRIAAAEAARKAAEEAERIAREAEAKEQEAIQNAEVGECADVGGAIAQADAAFSDFQKAQRAAARAEREQTARIPSVMGGRAQVMRDYEVLAISDAAAAIKCMGMTDKIRDAILSSARAYRGDFGQLPDGVTATTQRRM
jgi:hypothetical protein